MKMVNGFITEIALYDEFPYSSDGVKVYSNKEDLIAKEGIKYGIVEIEIKITQTVKEADFSIDPNKKYVKVTFDNGIRNAQIVEGKDV